MRLEALPDTTMESKPRLQLIDYSVCRPVCQLVFDFDERKFEDGTVGTRTQIVRTGPDTNRDNNICGILAGVLEACMRYRKYSAADELSRVKLKNR